MPMQPCGPTKPRASSSAEYVLPAPLSLYRPISGLASERDAGRKEKLTASPHSADRGRPSPALGPQSFPAAPHIPSRPRTTVARRSAPPEPLPRSLYFRRSYSLLQVVDYLRHAADGGASVVRDFVHAPSARAELLDLDGLCFGRRLVFGIGPELWRLAA